MSRTVLPPEALQWLSVWQEVRGLAVSRDLAFVKALVDAGHSIFSIAHNEQSAQSLHSASTKARVVARPDAIPAEAFQFEVVFIHQVLHRYPIKPTLAEIARTLRQGGCLSVSYLIRDDSVPWVRRLAALLRQFDPMAMRGDYGQDCLKSLHESHYFPDVEERVFRIWQPVSRDQLSRMVSAQPLAQHLDTAQREHLLGQVHELYDSAVRPGDTLRLPYQLLCARAWVDHAELTGPVNLHDDALSIPL